MTSQTRDNIMIRLGSSDSFARIHPKSSVWSNSLQTKVLKKVNRDGVEMNQDGVEIECFHQRALLRNAYT